MTLPAAVRLHRSVWARLAYGQPFQVVLTLVLLLTVGVVGGVAIGVHKFELPLNGALTLLALAVIWLAGVTAGAAAGPGGIQWRYFVPRRFSWDQVERVELTPFLAFGSGRPRSVVITVAGRERPVVPSRGCGRHLARFGRDVVALAQQRGIPVQVEDDPFWQQE